MELRVRPAQVAEVESLALSNGWFRRPINASLPQPTGTWRWRALLRFSHEEPLGHADRTTLDLHWRLAQHQNQVGFDSDQAYARSVPVQAIGDSVRPLCLADTFVHIAQHDRKEALPTLRHLVGVVRLVDTVGEDKTRQLAESHRNVALALITDARIAPALADLINTTDQRTRKLADDAWAGCLSLELSLQIRRELIGSTAIAPAPRIVARPLRPPPGQPGARGQSTLPCRCGS